MGNSLQNKRIEGVGWRQRVLSSLWGRSMRFVFVPCSLIAFCLPLAGCMTASDLNTASQALNVANSALNVANAVANDETPEDGATIPTPARSTPPVRTSALKPATARLPQSSGTTQRGAFEDCEKTYRAAGRNDLAAQCATRAGNMSSLR
jgi:hypothetical protein